MGRKGNAVVKTGLSAGETVSKQWKVEKWCGRASTVFFHTVLSSEGDGSVWRACVAEISHTELVLVVSAHSPFKRLGHSKAVTESLKLGDDMIRCVLERILPALRWSTVPFRRW